MAISGLSGSTVIQIVKYSELSVQQGRIQVRRYKVPLGLTCKNKLENYPASTTV
jgi:hypothetical protein